MFNIPESVFNIPGIRVQLRAESVFKILRNTQHPRFIPHFVPTSASWLNLVERWFGELTSKRIRRDSFHSVDDLIAAIEEFLAAWNDKPNPFIWTATVESIVDKLARCRQTLEQIQPGCTRPKAKRRKKRLSS